MNAMLSNRLQTAGLDAQAPTLLAFTLRLDLEEARVVVEGESIKNGQIPVANGFNLLQFTISDEDFLRGARMPTSPIEWLSANRQPIPVPDPFTVTRDSDQQIVVLDINRATVLTEFPFTISVFLDGRLYSSTDPTILNRPPS